MPSLGRMILEQTAPPAEPPTEETVKDTDEFVEEKLPHRALLGAGRKQELRHG